MVASSKLPEVGVEEIKILTTYRVSRRKARKDE